MQVTFPVYSPHLKKYLLTSGINDHYDTQLTHEMADFYERRLPLDIADIKRFYRTLRRQLRMTFDQRSKESLDVSISIVF